MSPKHCTEDTSHPLIKVEEVGRKAIFENPERSSHRKIRVDGCVIRQGMRADWAVEKVGVGTALVELKGRDIEHAADQIFVTARYWIDILKTKIPLGGLIVGSQYPRASASIQKKQAAFARAFNAPLRVINKEAHLRVEDVLGFR